MNLVIFLPGCCRKLPPRQDSGPAADPATAPQGLACTASDDRLAVTLSVPRQRVARCEVVPVTLELRNLTADELLLDVSTNSFRPELVEAPEVRARGFLKSTWATCHGGWSPYPHASMPQRFLKIPAGRAWRRTWEHRFYHSHFVTIVHSISTEVNAIHMPNSATGDYEPVPLENIWTGMLPVKLLLWVTNEIEDEARENLEKLAAACADRTLDPEVRLGILRRYTKQGLLDVPYYLMILHEQDPWASRELRRDAFFGLKDVLSEWYDGNALKSLLDVMIDSWQQEDTQEFAPDAIYEIVCAIVGEWDYGRVGVAADDAAMICSRLERLAEIEKAWFDALPLPDAERELWDSLSASSAWDMWREMMEEKGYSCPGPRTSEGAEPSGDAGPAPPNGTGQTENGQDR